MEDAAAVGISIAKNEYYRTRYGRDRVDALTENAQNVKKAEHGQKHTSNSHL